MPGFPKWGPTFALFSMPQVGGIIASRSSFYIAIADKGDDIQSGFKNNMHLTGHTCVM